MILLCIFPACGESGKENNNLSVKITPEIREVSIGEKITLKAHVRGTSRTPSFLWQYSEDGGKTWSDAGSDEKKLSFRVTEANAGRIYRCVVTVKKKQAVSNEALLFAASASAAEEFVEIGKTARFSTDKVWNSGGKTAYQWQYSRDGVLWENCEGESASSRKLKVVTSEENIGYRYRCVVTGKNGTARTNVVQVNASPRYYALIIGNGSGYRYQDKLPGVATDVKSMAAALRAFGWNVRTAENKTASQMNKEIRSTFQGLRKSDIALFYYSGHGVSSKGSSAGSLVGVKDGYQHDRLSAPELRDALLASKAGKIIVLLDSCGSGSLVYEKGESGDEEFSTVSNQFVSGVMSAFNGFLLQNGGSNTGELLNNRFVVLAACAYGQTSNDGYLTGQYTQGNPNYARGGLFTVALLRSMGCSYPGGSYSGKIPADTNKDNRLTLKEAYNGIQGQVSSMNTMLKKSHRQYFPKQRVYGYRIYEVASHSVKYHALFAQKTQTAGDSDFILFRK